MNITTVLELVKSRIGISSNVRDAYLYHIVEGVTAELEDEKGLVLDGANPYQLMFVVDYATWRYQNRDSMDGMPRHLQFRLHNLMIHVGAKNIRVDEMKTVDSLPTNPDQYVVYILDSDDSKQVYLNDQWVSVDLVDGKWVKV